jgi:hypothetical protein
MFSEKRGQTEVSMGTILLLVVGVIGVVVVGIFIYSAFDRGNQGIDALPGGFDVAVVACQSVLQLGDLGSEASYCSSFKKIDVGGNDQWASCDYLSKTWNADIDLGDRDWKCRNNQKVFCEALRESEGQDFDDSLIVDGKTCRSYGIYEETELQKLDREIRLAEEELAAAEEKLKQASLAEEAWVRAEEEAQKLRDSLDALVAQRSQLEA